MNTYQKQSLGKLDDKLIHDNQYAEILDSGKGLKSSGLITGYPGSGVFFIYELMRTTLAPIGLHAPGISGMISWQGIAPEFIETDRVIHIIRQPLKVISRAYTHLPEHYLKFIMYCCGLNMQSNRLRNIMLSYIHWTNLCEKRATNTYQIERMRSDIHKVYEDFGLSSVDYAIEGNYNNISRVSLNYDMLTWHDLEISDFALYEMIIAKAKKYRYIK